MGAQQLLKDAVIQIDRQGWARRGHVEFNGDQVLALEVKDNDLDGASNTLDHWAIACGGVIEAVQHVYRRGKRILYARVKR